MGKVRKIIRWGIVLLAVCLFSGFIFYKIGYADGSDTSIYEKVSSQKSEYMDNQNKLKTIIDQISNKQSELDGLDKKIAQKQTDISKSQSTATATNNKPTELSAGEYTVGKDIDQGTYDINLIEGSGVVSGENGFSMAQVFGNDNYSITSYKNAELIQGAKIEVSGTLKIKLDPK